MKTVTKGGWYVAYVSGAGIQGVQLSVHRLDDETGRRARGEGDGQEFASQDAAVSFCLRHGYLQPWPLGKYR